MDINDLEKLHDQQPDDTILWSNKNTSLTTLENRINTNTLTKTIKILRNKIKEIAPKIIVMFSGIISNIVNNGLLHDRRK